MSRRIKLLAVTFLFVVTGVGVCLPYALPRITAATEPAGTSVAHRPVVGSRARIMEPAEFSRAFQEVVATMRPSVVSIIAVRHVGVPVRGSSASVPEGFRRDFFGEDMTTQPDSGESSSRRMDVEGRGTGIIVRGNGLVLTNSHLVLGADEIRVSMWDGTTHPAQILGTDAPTEVAVLKVDDASGWTPATLGDSDSANVGEWVIAVGNPFGLDHTVTAGIISAKGRANLGIAGYEDFLQTDAAINPGNSGGPLVNLRGEVIGMNTAIASQSGASAGIGFAIPINMARSIMDSIIEKGRVQRGWLGAALQPLDAELAQSFQFKGDGVLISDVQPQGPASRAGLRPGDIVTRVNGTALHDVQEFRKQIAGMSPGSTVELSVFRDSKVVSIKPKLEEFPVPPSTAERQPPAQGGSEEDVDFGMKLHRVTPDIADRMGMPDAQGLIVMSVEQGSAGQAAGIRPKDVIAAVGSKSIRTIDDFHAAVQELRGDPAIRLQVIRNGIRVFAVVKNGAKGG
jgi:serine protease Do